MRFRLHRLFHRITGLCIAIPLILFVVTGLPLQFTGPLQLGAQGVPYAWVHNSYSISPPASVLAADGAVQIDSVLLLDQRHIDVTGQLLGTTALGDILVLATSKELILAPADVTIPVERTLFSEEVRGFGLNAEADLVIDTPAGLLSSDDLGSTWRATQITDALWFQVNSHPPTQAQAERYATLQVSWERWLQDLHSGRFFGVVGVWVMSIAGVAFIFLSFTGLYMWYATRQRNA